MLKDIQANILIPGITAQEIEQTLGISDTDAFFQSYDFVYYLGPEQGSVFPIDSVWLCINVDSHGMSVSAEVRTD